MNIVIYISPSLTCMYSLFFTEQFQKTKTIICTRSLLQTLALSEKTSYITLKNIFPCSTIMLITRTSLLSCIAFVCHLVTYFNQISVTFFPIYTCEFNCSIGFIFSLALIFATRSIFLFFQSHK